MLGLCMLVVSAPVTIFRFLSMANILTLKIIFLFRIWICTNLHRNSTSIQMCTNSSTTADIKSLWFVNTRSFSLSKVCDLSMSVVSIGYWSVSMVQKVNTPVQKKNLHFFFDCTFTVQSQSLNFTKLCQKMSFFLLKLYVWLLWCNIGHYNGRPTHTRHPMMSFLFKWLFPHMLFPPFFF